MERKKKEGGVLCDEQIIQLFWQRDEQAIAQTDKKYRNFLLSVAYNILSDSCDSEECLDDTYLGAWNAIPPTKPSSLRAFLVTIMRRTAIDRYKLRKRQKRISSELTLSLSEVEDFVSDLDDVAAEIDRLELSRIICAFVRSLNDRRRYIFMSRYYLVRPIKEIAKLLGCSESTVNKELAFIKRELMENLKREGYVL